MDHKKTAPIYIIAAAIDHIRSITPADGPWNADDVSSFSPWEPDESDHAIATILNAVVSGQLINRVSRDEMLAQVRRGKVFASAVAEGRRIADSDAGVYDADSAHGESKTGYWVPRRVAQDEIARLTAERDQALARLAAVHLEAIERCAALLIELGYVCESGETLANEVRGLRFDSDAQATLDKLLAEARLEGWRAGREAAADAMQPALRSMLSRGQAAATIRSLPEPKEAGE